MWHRLKWLWLNLQHRFFSISEHHIIPLLTSTILASVDSPIQLTKMGTKPSYQSCCYEKQTTWQSNFDFTHFIWILQMVLGTCSEGRVKYSCLCWVWHFPCNNIYHCFTIMFCAFLFAVSFQFLRLKIWWKNFKILALWQHWCILTYC